MSHPTPDAHAAAQLAKQGAHTVVFHSVNPFTMLTEECLHVHLPVAVSIVVFILQMHLHNIYVLVLLSLTYFPTQQLAVKLAPGNYRFK